MECEPDKLVLRYRYTLDELAAFLGTLKKRAEAYDEWISKVSYLVLLWAKSQFFLLHWMKDDVF